MVALAKVARRLINKKVRGMTCGCGFGGETQAGFIRHDACRCQLQGTSGKRGTVVDFPGIYSIGTIFVKKGAITEVPGGLRSGVRPIRHGVRY